MPNKTEFVPITFEAMIDHVWAEAREIAITRQSKYGPSNIPEFGVKGIIVRIYDKTQRAIHRWWKNAPEQADESDEDTFLDLVNYSIFCLCVMRGYWTKDKCPPLQYGGIVIPAQSTVVDGLGYKWDGMSVSTNPLISRLENGNG